MKVILALALILGLSSSVWAAVQTDTHTYIVSKSDNAVLAINRQTGEEMTIPVGYYPQSMVIHGGVGYVVNNGSDDLSVINLEKNTVTQTISVGRNLRSMVIHGKVGYVVFADSVSVLDLETNAVTQTIPVMDNIQSMVIHGDKGYTVNWGSDDVSVIDLTSNTLTQTIPVGEYSQSMVIHGNRGYVVNWGSDDVSVIDLTSNTLTQTISVGDEPCSLVIHGEVGYVVNKYSHNISVVDLTTNTVIQTIPVGRSPQPMMIHGGMGYVVNYGSNTVSVINLTSNIVIQTIAVGENPESMVIHGGMGYVVNESSRNISVIDLQTNRVVTTFENPKNKPIDFSDTHVYLALEKVRPLYPTFASISRAKGQKTLGEFVAMMPEVFKLGEIEPRLFPREENVFDTVPAYALAQEIFWDLKTNEPLMDPEDILATLITMKYPQKFLKTEAGAWLRNRLHMAFFQTVWSGDEDKAKDMLTYFVQLQDPVITKLATYNFKDAKESSDQKATNLTDLD